MASIKDLKTRIGSVKNTQQTTKAMKMVSAAKLRRAQEAITGQRPYSKQLSALIKRVVSLAEGKVTSPFIERDGDSTGPKKILLVLVASDRGLCGGFNSSVMKMAVRWRRDQAPGGATVHFGFVGRKAYDFFKTKEAKLGPNFAELSGKVDFLKAKKLSESLKELYIKGEYDEIKFVFNEFKNAVSQVVVVEDFLPIKLGGKEAVATGTSQPGSTIVKPSLAEVFEELMQKQFAVQAFRVMLESQASEHGARMSSMENATKNAGEMIRKLTLQYNKQRQANITKELLEIISGSEAQNG